MKIALAQINTTVGDFPGNRAKIREFVRRAQQAGAQVVLFPELSLCGYPPRDLVDKPSFVERNRRELESLARELPERLVFGVDLSLNALGIARENSLRHQVQARIFLVNSNWLTAIKQERRFALVVSNPPYIAAAVLDTLQPEVRDFEPHRALSGGADGLSEIRALAAQVHEVLVPGGLFFMEIGADQQEAVLKIFSSFPEYDRLQVHPDLAGLPRIFQARRC